MALRVIVRNSLGVEWHTRKLRRLEKTARKLREPMRARNKSLLENHASLWYFLGQYESRNWDTPMGILASFTDMLPVDVILASSDEPEIPRPRKPKKDSDSRSKQDGNRVLVIGRQRELALYRAEFLRLAGFTVLIAADVDEAIRIMQRGAFDAIVLSYTLPSRDVQYLADAARDYCSECTVIAISNSNTVDPRVQPDALVLADEGPTGLVSALKRVL